MFRSVSTSEHPDLSVEYGFLQAFPEPVHQEAICFLTTTFPTNVRQISPLFLMTSRLNLSCLAKFLHFAEAKVRKQIHSSAIQSALTFS